MGVASAVLLSACVVATNDRERESPIPGSGGSAGSAGAAGDSSAGSAGSSGSAGSGTSDSGSADSGSDSGDAAADSATDAGSDANGDGSASDGSSDGASTDGMGDGQTCDDSVSNSVDCSGVNPDPTCSVIGTPFQKSYCERAPTLFKPRVAQRIAGCIAGLTSLELCTPLVVQCITDGLSSACSDSSVGVQCSAIVSACPGLALAQCQLYLAGMTATARARMVSCMSAGCNLATCARDL